MLLITRLVKILMTGAGEVTQLVKYLPHQHEDLCEPHHPRKPNVCFYFSAGEARQEDP